MNPSFEQKLTCQHITFRYARGKSLTTGNEIHPDHEILFYLDGGATFCSEQHREVLRRGTLLIIPKEMYHHFIIRDQDRYERLTIRFPDPEPISFLPKRIGILCPIGQETALLLRKMRAALSGEYGEAGAAALYGAFFMLLAQLKSDEDSIFRPRPGKPEPIVSECIHYIGAHLSEPMTVRTIAEALHVSESTLSHRMKRALGISLHRYLIEKRMIEADKRIGNGERPTAVFSLCGYRDYSSFYKAYRKMFGHSPGA